MPTTSGYSINTGTAGAPTIAELDTIFQPVSTLPGSIVHTVPSTSLTQYYVGASTATDVSDMAHRYVFLTDVSNQEKYPKNTNLVVSRAGDFKDKDFKDIFQYGAYTSAITVANVSSYGSTSAVVDICGTYFYADVSGTSTNATTVSSIFYTKPYSYSLSGLSANTTYSYIVRPRNGFGTIGTKKTFDVTTRPTVTSFALDTVYASGTTTTNVKFTFAGTFSKAYIYSNDVQSSVIASTDTSKIMEITMAFDGTNIKSVCKIVPFNAAEDVSGTPITLTITDKVVSNPYNTLFKNTFVYGGYYRVIGGGGSGGSGGKGKDTNTQGGGGGGGGSGQFVGVYGNEYFYRTATKLVVDESVTYTIGAGGPPADSVGRDSDGNAGFNGGSSTLYIGNSGLIKTVTAVGGYPGGGGGRSGNGGGGGPGGNIDANGNRFNNGGGGANDGAGGGGGDGVNISGTIYGKGGGGSAGQKSNGTSQQSEAGGNGFCSWTVWYYEVT